MQQIKADGSGFAEAVERFEYIECPGVRFVPSWTDLGEAAEISLEPVGSAAQDDRPNAEKQTPAELERRVSEERRRAFESGRVQGIEEGRRAERSLQAEAVQEQEKEKVREAAGWLEQFRLEQERYFRAVEPEVVRLALAVAARVLRREASSDPLLLMGAVRAALGQLSGASEVRLRVPAAELELWTEAIALLPNLAIRPTVVASEGMTLGHCALETELGVADLNLSAQLAEIERALLGSGALPEAWREEKNAALAMESRA